MRETRPGETENPLPRNQPNMAAAIMPNTPKTKTKTFFVNEKLSLLRSKPPIPSKQEESF